MQTLCCALLFRSFQLRSLAVTWFSVPGMQSLRSNEAMTEPAVASSDATNIRTDFVPLGAAEPTLCPTQDHDHARR